MMLTAITYQAEYEVQSTMSVYGRGVDGHLRVLDLTIGIVLIGDGFLYNAYRHERGRRILIGSKIDQIWFQMKKLKRI